MDSSPVRRLHSSNQHAAPRDAGAARAGAASRSSATGAAERALNSEASSTSWADGDPSLSTRDTRRASIAQAHRVQIPSGAPLVARRLSTQPSQPTTPRAATQPGPVDSSTSPSYPAPSSVASPTGSTSSSRPSGANAHSGSYQFPASTAPSSSQSAPRSHTAASSMLQSSSSPRSYPQPTLGAEGDLFATSSTMTTSGSQRRKPPPPLALKSEEDRDPKGKRTARGDSSDSSELDEDWREEEPRGHQEPARRYGSRDMRPAAEQPSSSSVHPQSQIERSGSQDETRDTLSSLFKFPSPRIGSAGFAQPTSQHDVEDLEADDEAGEDDTAATGFSFLSSSSGGDSTRNLSADGLRHDSPNFGAARQYTGLGLGLPFSMSAAAGLSSLSPSLSPPISETPRNDRGTFRSPREGGERSRSTSGTSGPESPVTDRSKLIGLGELATPRWTSGVLERRWGTPYEEKRKASTDGEDLDPFSVSLREPLPTTARKLSVDSATATRPAPVRPTPRPTDSYESTSSARSSSYAMHPSTLFPATVSSESASHQPTALDAFANEPAPFSRPDFSRATQSQAAADQSLAIVSASSTDPTQETLRHSQVVDEAPRQFESVALQKRRSMGVPSSAPSSATGAPWTSGRSQNVVGLGFEYERQGGGEAATTQAQRRASSGSMQTTHSRRSSTGRAYSVDGNAKLPSKTTATHRRQSASKSGFAHLPPSPAAATATQAMAAAGIPIIPLTLPTPSSTASNPAPPTSQTTPHRTPDMARLSHHSHHSSPSLIAASILRQTRDPEGRDIDMDVAAAADEGTAEALRKLDGLSSPRLSKVFSSTPNSTGSRSRTTSRSGETEAEDGKRRRTRSSGSSAALAAEQSIAKVGPLPVSSSHTPAGSPKAAYSSPALASSSANAAQIPHSPLTSASSTMPTSSSTTRTPSQSRPGSSGNDVPFPTSSPFKRASSSSTSLTAGNSTSAAGSHDSTSATSATSVSGSSFTATGTRSSSYKNRRSSVGSDVSSTQGSGEGTNLRSERSESAGDGEVLRIPPVPPIPKDWETYRSPTNATSASSAQNSPHLDADPRRPSESSSFADGAMLSPRAAEMERSISSSSGASLGKVAPRKWSISNAFGKSSKSPKTPSIKESSSFTDLASVSRDRKSSFGSHISEPGFTRRMAASTNDIVGLANGTSDSRPTLGSLGRSSFRSDKSSAAMSRARTTSQSSSSTMTAGMTSSGVPSSAPPTPAVVTTSPGRSRSSLLSPRRTPSGIPFFRKNSSGSSSTAPASPVIDSSPPDEKSGRKSILGLNFLRSKESRREKEKEKIPTSPVFKHQTVSTMPVSASSVGSGGADEFGRRGSAAPKSSTTNLATRKRGKTLGSNEDPVTAADQQAASLPPMHMSALSAATVRRVDSLSSSHSSSSLSSRAMATPTRIQPPGSRASKLQESVKGNLPTIAGSPSVHTVPLERPDELRPLNDTSPSATPPPKSHTPTKIPRLYAQRPSAASSREVSPSGAASLPAKSATRRLSTYSSATPDTNVPSFSSNANIFGSENDSKIPDATAVMDKSGLPRRRVESEASQIPRSRSTNIGGSFASARMSKDPLDSSTSSRTSIAGPRNQLRQSVVGEDTGKSSATPVRSQPRTTSLHAVKSTPVQSASDVAALNSSTNRRTLPRVSDLSSSTRRASTATTADSLSSSKSARQLTGKMVIPSRVAKSSTTPSLSINATGSGRSSAASSLRSPSVTEEELRGDEEMAAYVRRQQAKKSAAGVSADVIHKMFEFPDPTEPVPPLESRDALSLYSRYLSPYEKEEICDYEKVYFVGPNCDKKPATKEQPTNNFGFDDDRGDYLLVPHDHIMFRYEVIDVLGKGSFGQVLQCRDHKTGEMVAIKIIRNKKRFHHQALVEIKVLENLVDWDPEEKHYVIRMVESFTFRGHLCIVTELLSINLYELVKANSFAGFTTTLIRRFTSQILGSLSLLRHHRVVHCDLKPENILLKHPAKSAIKVIDFGSSCFEHEKVYTYIQSRFYRSPEVILGMNYHMAIDMWSLGCIIAEMYTGYPIFPGENEQEQLACIMEVMGLPDKYLVDRSTRKRLFFDSTGAPRPVVNSKGRRRRPGTKTLPQVLKTDDELFVDFIAKCLTWDPDRRMRPDGAMRHPFIVAARSRALSPPIPPRSSRSSLAPSQGSSGSASSPQISTPRKKVPSASASTAPVQRTRTASSTAAPAHLASKGSLGLPSSSARYTLRS